MKLGCKQQLMAYYMRIDITFQEAVEVCSSLFMINRS